MLVSLVLTIQSNAQWEKTDGPDSGGGESVVVSGTSIFAGTGGGGVFLSTNGGTSWTGVNAGLTSPNVISLALSGFQESRNLSA